MKKIRLSATIIMAVVSVGIGIYTYIKEKRREGLEEIGKS